MQDKSKKQTPASRSNTNTVQRVDHSAKPFVNNRQEAIFQRELQERINTSQRQVAQRQHDPVQMGSGLELFLEIAQHVGLTGFNATSAASAIAIAIAGYFGVPTLMVVGLLALGVPISARNAIAYLKKSAPSSEPETNDKNITEVSRSEETSGSTPKVTGSSSDGNDRLEKTYESKAEATSSSLSEIVSDKVQHESHSSVSPPPAFISAKRFHIPNLVGVVAKLPKGGKVDGGRLTHTPLTFSDEHGQTIVSTGDSSLEGQLNSTTLKKFVSSRDDLKRRLARNGSSKSAEDPLEMLLKAYFVEGSTDDKGRINGLTYDYFQKNDVLEVPLVLQADITDKRDQATIAQLVSRAISVKNRQLELTALSLRELTYSLPSGATRIAMTKNIDSSTLIQKAYKQASENFRVPISSKYDNNRVLADEMRDLIASIDVLRELQQDGIIGEDQQGDYIISKNHNVNKRGDLRSCLNHLRRLYFEYREVIHQIYNGSE